MGNLDLEQIKLNWQKKEVVEIPNKVVKDPLVSIIVQTFNHVDYIGKCLDSLISQIITFPIEILLADDESKDGTREICLDYARKFPEKIKLFLHSRENNINIGGGPTANYAGIYTLLNARGKYIAVCEGDDLWTDPNKLQIQVDFLLLNPDYVLTYHPYVTIDSNGDLVESPEEGSQPKRDIEKKELSEGIYHPLLLTVCFKKNFREIPREMIEVINIDTFLFSFLGNYGKAKYLHHIYPSNYRKHPGGIWSARLREKKLLSKIVTYDKLKQYYLSKNNIELYNLYRKKHLNHYKMLLVKYFKAGNLMNFFSFLFKFLAARKNNL
ncbi:glycosyltransferase family A protein [soil metagenome]